MGDVIDLFPEKSPQPVQVPLLNVTRVEYRAHTDSKGRPRVAVIWLTEEGSPNVAALFSPADAVKISEGTIIAAQAAVRGRSYERDDVAANKSDSYTTGNDRVAFPWSFPRETAL